MIRNDVIKLVKHLEILLLELHRSLISISIFVYFVSQITGFNLTETVQGSIAEGCESSHCDYRRSAPSMMDKT